MALFQSSVLKKYLKALDDKKVAAAYQKFTAFFHNEVIIQNIREDKEEQFQYGFLQKLFDEVLDYTINPHPDYNLTTEFKNLRGSKKADGAILKNGEAIGVIELKSTKTKELAKITDQAFGYKNNHPSCAYVITSNFEKLRFYINDAVDYLDFDLFTLKEEAFRLLYLCLHKDHILSDLPQKIKQDSTLQEENVTKKLYKDYSAFKKALFNDLVMNNPDVPKLTLFKKSQKLLDRFLFVLFAEDKGLLPPNSISRIVETFDALEDLDNYKPLYEVFKQYFNYINTGRPARKGRAEIFAFNGGLFTPDEVLDNLKITDNILMNHTLILSKYDFETEVDVNILGHIFEHSLNEIDEMTAEIEGKVIDKNKTKRKKDGVFYTPKYITKYIVDNTVGKLCENKKDELGLQEEDFRPNRNKSTKKKLLAILEDYRSYLLNLTICDPACGSGAFLNQALDFLIGEHRYIDELQTKLLGGSIVLSDITNDILERNIYGVDINEESVEIARLSLWLRTAQKGRTLTSLNDNIKCGNSLIDDPEVAGDKAFDWAQEFPKVFERGGFDVVVGNPPYVPTEYIPAVEKEYLEKGYISAFGRINIFPIFYEKSILISAISGKIGLITPYTLLKNQYYIQARKFILDNTSIDAVIDFSNYKVFIDAAVDSIIVILTNNVNHKNEICFISNVTNFESGLYTSQIVEQNQVYNSKDLSFNVSGNQSFLQKIKNDTKELGRVVNFKQGIITGNNKKFLTKEKTPITKPVVIGRNFNRYFLGYDGNLIMYDTQKLHRPRVREIFEVDEKILLRQTGSYPIATLDFNGFYTLDTVHNGLLTDKKFNIRYLLGLINSKLLRYIYEASIQETGKVFAQVKIIYINSLPIKYTQEINQKELEEKVSSMISLNKELNLVVSTFNKMIKRRFSLEKLSSKLNNWYLNDFDSFLKELKKKKVKLSLTEEAEWEEYFETEKAKAQALQAEIDKTDREIDQMVYALYGLTEEEIKIVEGSIK
jgi:hypothetical protein